MQTISREAAGSWLAAVVLASLCQLTALRAASIAIANPSFELPQTNYVNTNIDFWQKSPKPASYVENGGFLWSQLTGVFANTAPGEDDHIDNADASQAIYLFAVPEAGLSQDLSAAFEIGKAFDFTAGVIGGGGGMADHVTMELRLYYRNAAREMLTIASAVVEQSVPAFPSTNHFVDIHVHLSGVKPTDAWAGQPIGVQFFSTVNPDLQGGYWDLDNARLVSTIVPEASAGVLAAFGLFILALRRPALKPGKGNGRTRAFTLLELLVVLAVISVLAALILPTLASVRESARGTACVSNLRQIGAGIALYSINHDSEIPYGPKALPYTSPASLYPASGSPTSLISLPNGAPVALGLIISYLRDPRVLFCPGSDQPQDADDELERVGHAQAQCSYYYRHASVTKLFDGPGEIAPPDNIKFASLGENRRGKPVRALVMDTLFYCPMDLGQFNITSAPITAVISLMSFMLTDMLQHVPIRINVTLSTSLKARCARHLPKS